MPGKGTPKRPGIRVDDVLWEAAKDKAKRLGVDLATIQRDMLRAWEAIPDALWSAAITKAQTQDQKLSDLIRGCLQDYVNDDKQGENK